MYVRKMLVVLGVFALTATIGGCVKPSETPAPVDGGGVLPHVEKPSEKMSITAYINVASGCQASTVELLEALSEEYADHTTVELVDFGSPEGAQRWRSDGMECMAFVFDQGDGPSPVVKFPNREGKTKTVVFFMPAGFGWQHEDLEDVFAAIKDGKAALLSEEEARKALAPKMVEVTTSVKETDKGVQVLLDGQIALTVKADADGKTAKERAEVAQAAIDEWLAEPVQPNDLKVAAKDEVTVLQAGEIEIMTATKADADSEKMKNSRQVANVWGTRLKKLLVQAAQESSDTEE